MCLDASTVSLFVGIGSFIAGIASLILAWKVKKDADERERSLVPNARSLADASNSYLGNLKTELGETDKYVREYASFNHTIICTLGALSKRFAESWVEEYTDDKERAKWKRIFGLTDN